MAIDSIGSQKTIQEIIDSSSSVKSSRNTGDLGKDDFLNLLVTQLKYQDPLNPQEDKEFIAQMAQFSSLEQMQNMNTAMLKTQSFALIGKYITAESSDGISETVEGYVTGVRLKGSKAYAVVNGEDISVDKITDVTI